MEWVYLAAMSAAVTAGNYYQGALRSPGDQPGRDIGLSIFHTAGAASAFTFLALLIVGFVMWTWWLPVVGFLAGCTVSILADRVLSRAVIPGWIILFTTAAIVLGAVSVLA